MDRSQLSSLKRPQLQQLARRESLKANLKSVEIIRLLLEKHPDGVPDLSQKSPAPKRTLSSPSKAKQPARRSKRKPTAKSKPASVKSEEAHPTESGPGEPESPHKGRDVRSMAPPPVTPTVPLHPLLSPANRRLPTTPRIDDVAWTEAEGETGDVVDAHDMACPPEATPTPPEATATTLPRTLVDAAVGTEAEDEIGDVVDARDVATLHRTHADAAVGTEAECETGDVAGARDVACPPQVTPTPPEATAATLHRTHVDIAVGTEVEGETGDAADGRDMVCPPEATPTPFEATGVTSHQAHEMLRSLTNVIDTTSLDPEEPSSILHRAKALSTILDSTLLPRMMKVDKEVKDYLSLRVAFEVKLGPQLKMEGVMPSHRRTGATNIPAAGPPPPKRPREEVDGEGVPPHPHPHNSKRARV